MGIEKGATVYGVEVTAFKKNWSHTTLFNFMGKKFETYEDAAIRGEKCNVEKIYGKGATKSEITIIKIENYLTPDCKLTKIKV